jgi:hypothetical protein
MNLEGDLVLIHYQETPTVYARIESIEPDVKKDWYRVGLLLLTIPAQTATWILREEYINGTSFTMGGESMRLEEVKRLSRPPEQQEPGKSAKVLPFKKSSED